jgi:hypothetical protein
MFPVIKEIEFVHATHTRTRLSALSPGRVCALCQRDTNLISVSAAARIGKANPLRVLEWVVSGLGEEKEPVSMETLVCLDCLSGCRLQQPGSPPEQSLAG